MVTVSIVQTSNVAKMSTYKKALVEILKWAGKETIVACKKKKKLFIKDILGCLVTIYRSRVNAIWSLQRRMVREHA